ncbi:P-loop containing nucleoside triphosphate hydrolase protein [Daedalea quercina L-15889]|uniref:p-loop containing nucleoside triphosphate hydrolase protein n=1 Tax=Daedalea quercina L-15889 TaxID=1314783 RepID=A0A165S6K6_9APHY|nr:P-loop containing nucleoside triphosphate hydrolase protein [Daedalea quercina L-15889]
MSLRSPLAALRNLCLESAHSFPQPCPRARHRDPLPQKPHSSYGHPQGIYALWAASRKSSRAGEAIGPGAHRPFSVRTLSFAFDLIRLCVADLLLVLWSLHPWRSVLLIILELVRGVFPAFRGYSQALLINELQALITSNNFTWTCITRHIAVEFSRLALEAIIDAVATENENVVYGSAKYALEYRQMEKRLKLDLPTLADPEIRDLFRESDLFVRSFGGMSSFGLFSTFDFMRILTSISELISHALVLSSLTFNRPHLTAFCFSVLTSLLPLILRSARAHGSYVDEAADPQGTRAIHKQEKMRHLAQSESYRQELIFFGLGPWILQGWAKARRIVLGLERQQTEGNLSLRSLVSINLSSLTSFVQNVPLVLLYQSPSASLGLFTLYQTSVQAIIFTTANLIHSIRMAYQGVFLMGAFCAAMEIQPVLQPRGRDAPIKSSGKGMRLDVKNLTYTYPGCESPVLRNVSLTVEAGETVAIVGFNGSGKSTLAKILLRMYDFDSGDILVNGVNIKQYAPEDYHSRCTAVFQDFAKYSGSAQENIGVGCIDKMRCAHTLDMAMRLAGAKETVCSLPKGLQTKLDIAGQDSGSFDSGHFIQGNGPAYGCHGLSGGEWQRIAISRAFMRADRPEVELLVFDEPTSSLDAHAQKRIFDSIEKICRSASSERKKSVIFITHRLSTARRADKIAMMESGTICEFGTHQELLSRDGQYAALYRASI